MGYHLFFKPILAIEIEQGNDMHKVYVSKNSTKRYFLVVLVGLIGVVVTTVLFDIENRITQFLLSFAFVVIGYWGLALKIFPKDKK